MKRSVKMLERVSSVASSETLIAALSSPTDVGGVASLLSDLAPLGIDLSAVDPLVEAMSVESPSSGNFWRAPGVALNPAR
jgi:hypothetical protein